MEFKINCWDVFKNVVGFNLLITLGIQLSHLLERHGGIPNEIIPYVLVVANALLFFGVLADPPLRFIKIDKQANIISYALLFRSLEIIDYTRLQSRWIIRRTGRWRDSTRNVLAFMLDGQEVFSLGENSSGWSTNQPNSIHELLFTTNQ